MLINGIDRHDIANYLGVSYHTIVKYCNGDRNVTDDIKAKIVANNLGWDASPFTNEDVIDKEKAMLVEENLRLRESIKHLEAINERYLAMLEMLTDRLSGVVKDLPLKVE